GAVVICGGDFDPWDLHVRGGLLGAARGLVAVEEHGGGRQMIRLSVRPWSPFPVVAVLAGLSTLSIVAFADAALLAGTILALLTVLLGCTAIRDCGRAAIAWLQATERLSESGVKDGD